MDVDRLLQRITFMARKVGDYELKYIIKLFLLDVDVPTYVSGFEILVQGILYLHTHPGAMLTKELYPVLAKEFGLNGVDVEIAMRRAIEKAWKTRNEKWSIYFPGKRKPKNHEFMNSMCQILSLWEMCRDKMAAEGAAAHD